jgi:hypothetical protein
MLSSSNSFSFPTFSSKSKPAKEICIKDLSPQGLKELKETDSFMYYSIPQDVRKAVSKDTVSMKTKGEKVIRKSCVSETDGIDIDVEDILLVMKNFDLNRSDEFGASFDGAGEDDDLFLSFFTPSRKRKIEPATN